MFSSRTIVFFLTFLVALVSSYPARRCPQAAAATRSPSVVAPSLGLVKGSATPISTSSSTSRSTSRSTSSSTSRSTSRSTSTSTSTSKAAPTPTGIISGLINQLFPVSSFSKSWSTSPAASNALALSDATFRPTNVLRSVVHSYANAPDGKKAMKAHYPKGSYTFGFQPQGGFSFYAPGPASVDLSTAKEATFGYSAFFPQGFAFNLGGKLPGLYGGNSDSEAVGCSGGRRSGSCFSVRLMWRSGGDGEFYTYLPPYTESQFAVNEKLCRVAPQSDCNPTYGASVGRGSFKFPTGQWTTISERVRLNDVGQANGQIELFVNGKSVINVSGLILRDSGAGRIRGLQMQTFFGGSKPQFASPKDQDVFFSDFSVAITRTL